MSAAEGADLLEIEAKFYVADHASLVAELEQRGAELAHQRHLERNWRFDLPDRSLKRAGTVFRLRVDPQTTLTVKQPQASELERQEFELAIDDHQGALRLVDALGYQTVAIYEKYRTEYLLGHIAVMLDELPFGNFVELEGPSVLAIEQLAAELGLDWGRRIPDSYLDLFGRLRAAIGLDFRDATFAAFADAPQFELSQLGLAESAVQPERG